MITIDGSCGPEGHVRDFIYHSTRKTKKELFPNIHACDGEDVLSLTRKIAEVCKGENTATVIAATEAVKNLSLLRSTFEGIEQ